MEVNIKSIPEIIAYYGNVTNAARATGFSEMTIYKYATDTKMFTHCVVNGQLMTARKNSKPVKRWPEPMPVKRVGERGPNKKSIA